MNTAKNCRNFHLRRATKHDVISTPFHDAEGKIVDYEIKSLSHPILVLQRNHSSRIQNPTPIGIPARIKYFRYGTKYWALHNPIEMHEQRMQREQILARLKRKGVLNPTPRQVENEA